MPALIRFKRSSCARRGSSHPRRPSIGRLSLGAVASIGSIALTAGDAQAITVTVGGKQWDVTTFTGSYNDNSNKFQTPGNGGVMPWWGQVTEASAWADTLGWALGDPNTGLWDSSANLLTGPAFGWSIGNHPVNNDEIIYTQYVYSQPPSTYPGYLISPINMGDLRSRSAITWAQASLSVPAPLPALGAFAALSFSRKLRKRIKNSASIASITYSF
jgi:hypothetical protein